MSPKAPQNPFPGPQPYRASDRGRFYGREAVSQELTDTILAHRCVALYGPSGAGKSSVMQAGVIPALEEAHDFRFVAIDGWPADETPVAWLLYTLISALKLVPPEGELGLFESVEWIVRQAFRRSDRPILIYLDQLEQLLLPSREVASVEAFLDWLDRFAERPLRGLHLVLSMREDYLGRFRDRARGRQRLLEDGMRLGPMTVGEIVGAVVRTAADGDPPQTWSAGPMRALMMQVRIPGQRESDDAEVQTAFAQIVCRALFGERAAAGGLEGDTPVHAEPILFRYLENTLEALGPLRAPAERLLEDHLIAADGTRTLLTEEAARASGLAAGEQLDTLLHELERAAILRAEQHRGTRYFELGHDWLAKKVFDRKQERAARLAEAAREAVRAAELLAAKAETRRARRVVAVVTAFALVAVGLQPIELGQHPAPLVDLSLSPDGRTVAAAAADGSLRLYPRSGGPALVLQDSGPPITDLAFSPDGRHLAIATRTGESRLYPAAGGPPRLLAGHEGAARALAFSPKAGWIASVGDDGAARLWRVDDPAAPPIILRGHRGAVYSLAFSPDGERLVTAGDDRSARIWRPRDPTGAPIVLTHPDAVYAAEFSPKGDRLVTAARDRTVRVWSADRGGKPLELSGHTDKIYRARFDPRGERVASASRDGTARVWRLADPTQPRVLRGHTGPVIDVSFSGDGRRLVSASADGSARVWSAADERRERILRGAPGPVSSASLSADGRWAIATAGARARAWPLSGSAAAIEFDAGAIPALSAAILGDRAYTAHEDGALRIWRLTPRRAELTRTVELGLAGRPSFVVVSPDGRRALAGLADRAFIVDLDTRARVELRGHQGAVLHGAFSPDGARVITASDDRSARIWPTAGGAPILLRGHEGAVYSALFSPDGARVVTASWDRSARVWSAAGGPALVVLAGHEAEVRDAAFSPDGARVITASDDRTAKIWRSDGSGDVVTLYGHDGPVHSAAFSADGERAITGAVDRSVRIWPANFDDPQLLRGQIDAATTVCLQPEERRALLGEAPEDAAERSHACEARAGR
jgi:WD40 repeat protein